MNQESTTLSRIGALLVVTIAITIVDSYVPRELNLVRQMISLVQLGFMLAIMVLAVRSILSDF